MKKKMTVVGISIIMILTVSWIAYATHKHNMDKGNFIQGKLSNGDLKFSDLSGMVSKEKFHTDFIDEAINNYRLIIKKLAQPEYFKYVSQEEFKNRRLRPFFGELANEFMTEDITLSELYEKAYQKSFDLHREICDALNLPYI